MTDEASTDPHWTIAAIEGVESAHARRLLAEFANALRMEGVRLAGVLDVPGVGDETCRSYALQNLEDGIVFPISQNLGGGSSGCALDPDGLARACAAVQSSIERGVDLVILNKFGREEACRRGLTDAFFAAVSSGARVLTTVSETRLAAWREFVGDDVQRLAPDAAVLRAWWAAQTK